MYDAQFLDIFCNKLILLESLSIFRSNIRNNNNGNNMIRWNGFASENKSRSLKNKNQKLKWK